MQLVPMYDSSALERRLREGVRPGYLRKDLNPVIAARVLPGMLMFFLMVQEVLTGRRMVPYGYDEIVPEAVRGVFFRAGGPAGRGAVVRQPEGGVTGPLTQSPSARCGHQD